MNFETFLEEKIKKTILSWSAPDIYAVSFLLVWNETSADPEERLTPEFSVGYNTEKFCNHAGLYSEGRWNYAFWEQNNTILFDNRDAYAAGLFSDWCKASEIAEAGKPESEEAMYDEDFNYIGKGPNGNMEFLGLLNTIVTRLRESGWIAAHLGTVPILIHDLEYSWYTLDATRKANPNGEADAFLHAIACDFECEET